MRVAIDISPTKTGHGVRGIGTYTQNLVNEFKKGKWQDVNFEFFQSPASPPTVDVIHYPYFDFFFHTLPIFKKANRVVATIHDVIPLIFPNHFPQGIKAKFNFSLQKLALKNIDGVICVSKTTKNDVVNKLSVPKDKVHVVYSAQGQKFKKLYDKNQLFNVSNKFKLPQNFFLFVGDVNWNKNIIGLLEAVALAEINLVMVGKALVDVALAQVRQIDKKIKDLGIDSKITKTGYVSDEDLCAIYNLATATVMPSFYEGFGFPVLESMACQTPVIASKEASISEVAGDAAIYFNARDPKDIASKISHLLNFDKKSEEKLKEVSLKQAAKFRWSKTAQETIDVYKLIHKINGSVKRDQ